MDSLTAIELKNTVQKELGIDLPIIKFIGGTNIFALATELSQQLGSTEGNQEIELLIEDKVTHTGTQNSDWIEGEI
ncbi:MAG TPA: acyl carrier protein, partial [Nostocaceae cyanobacterium]|nr:acyl carrier protein [Nostocaceae cyanobacterium]